LSLTDRFARAISFCLKEDGDDGDTEALARWALGEGGETALGEASAKVTLVYGGATKIKGYVFESARLPEIRGASALLDRINRIDIMRLWRESVGCIDCVIYANGGEVLAFAPMSKAAWLADEIERLYTQETMVAQSVAVWRAFDLNQIRNGLLAGKTYDEATVIKLLGYVPAGDPSFGSLIISLALDRFRRRESNDDQGRKYHPAAHIETIPYMRRCSSCERRAAVTNARVAEGDDRPLCEPCARKRIYGQLTKREDADRSWWKRERFVWDPEANNQRAWSWTTYYEDWLEEDSELKISLRQNYAVDQNGNALGSVRDLKSVRDLGEIAQASSPQGFIGVVYADGNNMGQILEHLRTPARYATFADEVYQATQGAVFEALAQNLRPKFVQRERGGNALVHPFEILSIGGDDVLLIVPADVAIPLACDVAVNVERELLAADPMFKHDGGGKTGYEWNEVQRCVGEVPMAQCEVSLSAGVVIADAHTPIFYLEELVGQLLKSAKRRAKWLKRERNYYGGTVDFLTLKSVTNISGTIEQFRADALRAGNRRLYARPYTIEEARKLLETIRLLKNAGFPRSQLYRLRESLHSGWAQSSVDYHYFLSRGQDLRHSMTKIEEMWTPAKIQRPPHPWRRQLENGESWETIWFDLVEIYDFVSADGGADAED
jgi:CRISPR-associated protein Cmr2